MKANHLSFKNVPSLEELKKTYPTLKAVFFDMDGTLFNSEGVHAKALSHLAKKHQIHTPYDERALHELFVGKADYLIFEIIKNWKGVPHDWTPEVFIQEKNHHMIQIIQDTHSLSFYAQEIHDLILTAKKENIYLAVVTSSERVITEAFLNRACILEAFDLILTRNDCSKHKPDPYPYLKATEISSFKAKEILVFEDSQIGLTAATLAGTHVGHAQWYL